MSVCLKRGNGSSYSDWNWIGNYRMELEGNGSTNCILPHPSAKSSHFIAKRKKAKGPHCRPVAFFILRSVFPSPLLLFLCSLVSVGRDIRSAAAELSPASDRQVIENCFWLSASADLQPCFDVWRTPTAQVRAAQIQPQQHNTSTVYSRLITARA